jgi:proline iminopeptidase
MDMRRNIIPGTIGLLPMPTFLTGCIKMPKTTTLDPALPRTMINGYEFHTEVYGDGNRPTVIVIHGGPGGDFTYLKSLQALSGEYRVVFYDQRGTGLSPRENAEGHSIDLFLKDLDGLVDAFRGNGRVRLIGHSWGGMLATAYIARYGDKVSHAVIMEPGVLNPTSARIFFKSLKEHQSFRTMVKASPYFVASLFVAREDGHEPKDYVMTRILGSGRGKPYQCEGEGLPPGSFTRAGYASFAALMMPYIKHPEQFTFDLAAGADKYPGPVLLLSSECSFIGYDYQEAHHRKLFPASTRHVMIPKTGHNMVTLKPVESLTIIRSFLKSHESTP